MNLLLKSVIVVDPSSKHHLKKRDILIEKGVITNIQSSITNTKKVKEIQGKNYHVSPGWFDMSVHFCDPGQEHREDLESGLNAAAKGGFTGVCAMPNTEPSISTKSQVEYIKRKSQSHLVEIEVAASLSALGEGNQISEFGDLNDAGAKAFTDYKSPINKPELMIRALEYAKNFDQVIISFPFDNQVSPDGLIHESEHSVKLGLKGLPEISEEIRLQRDIDFLRYSESKMHVNLISTARSVELIRNAKKEGLNITCGIAAHQLSFLDSDLHEFDTRLKVLPPFRSSKDQKALVKGLADGTIDVVCSDHTPIDIDQKKTEFNYAEFGISGIESAFQSILTTVEDKVTLEDLISKITTLPRQILDLGTVEISENQEANLTVFDPISDSTFDTSDMISKSKNNPFNGALLKGKVIGVIHKNQSTL